MDDLSKQREADLSKKRELAEEAKGLLENKAFTAAMLDLRKRWFDELMTAAESTDEKLALIAQMKTLEAVAAALNVLVNDYKISLKRQQTHG
jgi:hypothetical protein